MRHLDGPSRWATKTDQLDRSVRQTSQMESVCTLYKKVFQQAGAELGQAQLKLELKLYWQLVDSQLSAGHLVLLYFPFNTILIRLEIAEIDIASYSQLQLVVACGQLVISSTPSLIVLVENTNFPFYKISICLEIAELDIASCCQWQLLDSQ